MNVNYFPLIIAIIAWQSCIIQTCKHTINDTSGVISDSRYLKYSSGYYRCNRIKVPSGHQINISIKLRGFDHLKNENCTYSFVEVKLGESECSEYCSDNKEGKQFSFTARNDSYVDVNIYALTPTQTAVNFTYNVKFSIQQADIQNNKDALVKAIDLLLSKRTKAWGWQENTARAITALFLAGGVNFNGSILEEELMAKQAELRVAAAILKNTVSTEDLSNHIHALLVICHDPRSFYGNNLVKNLLDKVQSSGNFTHPIAYLALCNANETWPSRAKADLNNVLNNNSNYPFVTDMKAFAILAVSCMDKQSQFLLKPENLDLKSHYQWSISELMQHQTSDGSFGDTYATALITQALLSSGQENTTFWNQNAVMKYLIKELNSTSIDIVSIYLTLPILNGKTLADISKVNCSTNPRKHGDDPDPLAYFNDDHYTMLYRKIKSI